MTVLIGGGVTKLTDQTFVQGRRFFNQSTTCRSIVLFPVRIRIILKSPHFVLFVYLYLLHNMFLVLPCLFLNLNKDKENFTTATFGRYLYMIMLRQIFHIMSLPSEVAKGGGYNRKWMYRDESLKNGKQLSLSVNVQFISVKNYVNCRELVDRKDNIPQSKLD